MTAPLFLLSAGARRRRTARAGGRGAVALQLLLLVLPISASAAELPTDAPRSAFARRREVELAGAAREGTPTPAVDERPGFAELPLPPELAGSSEPAYHDLRLVRSDGREVPYLLEFQSARHEIETTSSQIIAGSSTSTSSTWLVDLLQLHSFDALELQIDAAQFAKQVTVEGAAERSGPFRTLRSGAGVFDRPWSLAPGWRVRHTSVDWELVQTARYLKITFDNSRSSAIELQGVTAVRHRATQAQMWTRTAPLVELPVAPPMGKRALVAPTKSRYRLDLPPGLPVEQLLVRASELALVRPVRLLELPRSSRPGAEPPDERELASDTLYRLGAGAAPVLPPTSKKHPPDESHIDAQLQAEWLTLRLGQVPTGGTLVLEIDNGDSPPLSDLQVEVYGCGVRLIFEYPGQTPAATAATPGAARKWALYYGNPAARAPHYDLEALRDRLTRLGPLHPAHLLPEQPNPRYQPAPPLQFVPTIGAPLATASFRFQQALRVTGGQDIYAVTLDPVAIGLTRADFGDLRIVDAQDRQVPYVLSTDAGDARAELTATATAEPHPRTSRYHLTVSSAGDPRPLALPLLAVELVIRDTFYSRAVRLLAPAAEGSAPRLLFAGTLQRHGEDAAGLHSLALAGERLPELILEIDDEDNPPLVLQQLRGVVRAPRLAFKLTPGDGYRLLLGDDDTAAPHYDIETLRKAVLDYAALPAQLDRLEPNRAYRSRTSDYLLHAPPTALLWGALLLAIAVLLGITIRLLGKTPPPETPDSPS